NSRHRDNGAVVATHAVDCDGDIHASFPNFSVSRQENGADAVALRRSDRLYLFALGLDNLATAIEPIRADVVTQMDFTGRRFDCQRRCRQTILGTTHAALGRRLLVLLNGHGNTPDDLAFIPACRVRAKPRERQTATS